MFQGLSPGDLALIKSCLHERDFDKGETLFSEGSPCERIFIVETGRVKVYRMSSTGREQIVEMMGPGDTCACHPGSGEWSCSSSAEAVVPSKVWFFSRTQYAKLVQSNPKMSLALNRVLAEKLHCFGSLIEEVSLKDARKRVVKFLLDLHAQEPHSGKEGKSVLPVPFTREELAQRIGVARETAVRHLHQLKRDKLIEIEPHRIVILDREGLEKLLD